MHISNKVLTLLKQIFEYHKFGEEDLVSEDPDSAVECVLQEIVDRLFDRNRKRSPLYVVTDSAVSHIRTAYKKRIRAKEKDVEEHGQPTTP